MITRLGQAVSPAGRDAPLRGEAMGRLEVLEGDIWIAVNEGEIVSMGPGWRVRPRLDLQPGASIIDAHGMVALPGLIDCHTHACFAGDRVAEFELRARGASYEELHAAGGGILSTVTATREADHELLSDQVIKHLAWMLKHGTTAVEVKSGYGLEVEAELEMLRAIRTGAALSAQRVYQTVLALHAVPPEAESADAYVETCIDELLVEVADWNLATAADAFVERGAFDVDQARRYLEAARGHELALRLHGDQFAEIGAVGLAIELGARSIDHLEATGPEGVAALAASDVTAVLLPTAALQLRRPFPPGRALIDAGAAVAIASDMNPGSSFCESLPLQMSLACTQMGLSPAEALVACTVNAAHVVGEGERLGRLRVGAPADIVVLDAPDWRHVAYHLGNPQVRHVICDGVWSLGEPAEEE